MNKQRREPTSQETQETTFQCAYYTWHMLHVLAHFQAQYGSQDLGVFTQEHLQTYAVMKNSVQEALDRTISDKEMSLHFLNLLRTLLPGSFAAELETLDSDQLPYTMVGDQGDEEYQTVPDTQLQDL